MYRTYNLRHCCINIFCLIIRCAERQLRGNPDFPPRRLKCQSCSTSSLGSRAAAFFPLDPAESSERRRLLQQEILSKATMGKHFLFSVLFCLYFAHDALAFAEPATCHRHHASTYRQHVQRRDGMTPSTLTRCRVLLSAAQTGNSQTDSNFIIDDQVVGSGPAATNGDIVTVKYTGRLQSNGKQFDAHIIVQTRCGQSNKRMGSGH